MKATRVAAVYHRAPASLLLEAETSADVEWLGQLERGKGARVSISTVAPGHVSVTLVIVDARARQIEE